MPFKDGDFLEIEYTARNVADNALIATTDESIAKKEEAYSKDISYGPVLVVLGANAVVKGLERELKNAEVGKEIKFKLKPEDAFGNRSEDLVRVMPLSEFRAQNINPYPGMRINMDSAIATVKSVGSGRVVVDANHPDAGKEIDYTVKVIKLLEKDEDRISALGKTYSLKPTRITKTGGVADIYFDSTVKKNSDYFINKASMVAATFTYLKDVEKINVHEEYDRKSATAPEATHEESEEESEESENESESGSEESKGENTENQ